MDLLAYLSLPDIGGTRSNSAANDIWGWTDPQTGKEYAIVGRVFGTSFIDISDPTQSVYLGQLPTHCPFGSFWRDIKVHADHAYIVSEATNHGMQVFHLRQLRNVSGPPVTFSETAHYNRMSSAHNIAVNEASGFAYIVGASGRNSCKGGLHMVDLQEWLTEDLRYFLLDDELDDELDEQNFAHNTQTRVWDVSDLDKPTVHRVFDGTTTAIDHNQHVKDGLSYQANYRAGLRIIDATAPGTTDLREIGYFDIYPGDDAAEFNGAWSNYPFFASGVVVVSGIEQGLFVLRPTVSAN